MTIRSLSVGPLGTNCYVVADQNGVAAVVDPGEEAGRIKTLLEQNGWTVGAVLLTHVHFDHIGALKRLVEKTGAPVYCHELEVAALSDPMRNLSGAFGMPLETVAEANAVKEGDTVTVGELTLTVLHTPGHTPGSVCYRIEDVLFSGDTLFCESIGRTDFPGGSVRDMQQSLRRLLGLEDAVKVYPGHDEPTSIGHEKMYNPYV